MGRGDFVWTQTVVAQSTGGVAKVVEVTVEWLKEMRYTTQHKFSHMTKQASQVSPAGGGGLL